MESQRLDNFVGVWMGIDRKVMNRYNWKSNGPGGCDDHNIEHPCGLCIKGDSRIAVYHDGYRAGYDSRNVDIANLKRIKNAIEYELKEWKENHDIQLESNRDAQIEIKKLRFELEDLREDLGFWKKESELHAEGREEFKSDLSEAIRLLESGKRQFAPNTTNSDVDMFLAKMKDKLLDQETRN